MLKKSLIALALTLSTLLVLGLVGGTLWWQSTQDSALPWRSGEYGLQGLKAHVDVRFDAFGVPHILATAEGDVFRALGFLHANDRMTQMELGRRAAVGRLSELLGSATVDTDIYFRTLRFGEGAEVMWQSAAPSSRAALEAYAEGVNAWLAARGDDLPPGLEVLMVEPEPWRPQDSLAFAMLMSQDLSFWDARPEEERYRWLRAFGSDRLRDLLDQPDLYIAPEIVDMAAAERAAESRQENASLNGYDPSAVGNRTLRGSNNWAIGGSRTASGKPLLANDPHLGLFLPSVWYQVHMRGPEYEAAGMTLPGTPGVVIGRGPEVAWAFTNVMLDDHDIFFEELDDTGTRYRRGDEWLDLEVWQETVHVRGGDSRSIEVRKTDRGPLLDADAERGLPTRSVTWTAHQPSDPLAALFALAATTTPEEVLASIGSYVGPAQNLVAAFPGGDLLYTPLGRIPARRVGDGRMPTPGWDTSYGWDGLSPRDTYPQILRPEDDIIVTANNDIRPAGYDLPLTAEFFRPFRADQIRQRLMEVESWQREDFAAVQMDDFSRYALDVLDAMAGDAPFEGDAARAFEAFESWDRRMSLKGPSALFALLDRELSRAIFADEAVQAGVKPLGSRDRLHRMMRGEMSALWFDDVSTDAVESRHEMLERALSAAFERGVELFGSDRVADWDYGWLHSLRLEHRLNELPIFGSWARRGPYPVAGSASTVLAFGARWRDDGRQQITYGPSMRWIVDWSEPDRAWAVLPGGQSGHPGDAHYDDQIQTYVDGGLNVAPWSEAAIEEATAERMRLRPAKTQ